VTIQDLGSIGELLAAIATIATLAYLAVQLKQSTASTRASSAAAHSEANRNMNLVMAQDAGLTSLYWSGLANRSALGDEDRKRFDFVLGSHIMSFEQMWQFRRDGVVILGIKSDVGL
jgi:hypothetical protein